MAPSDPVRDSERRLISCCTDDCAWAKDGYCDDGGPGAQFAGCLIGSDCHDCCGKDQACKESRCQQEIVLRPESAKYDFNNAASIAADETVDADSVANGGTVDVELPDIDPDPVRVAPVYALGVDGSNGCASLTEDKYEAILSGDQCKTAAANLELLWGESMPPTPPAPLYTPPLHTPSTHTLHTHPTTHTPLHTPPLHTTHYTPPLSPPPLSTPPLSRWSPRPASARLPPKGLLRNKGPCLD